MKEQHRKQSALGSTGVVEDLVRQGRTPVFAEPVTMDVNGTLKNRVPCTIPGVDGQEPTLVFLYPPSATQIMQRIKHAQTRTENQPK